VSRRLLLALSTAALAAASLAATSPADAYHRYRPCVVAKNDATFYPHPNRCHGHHHHHCGRWVGGRAFRIKGEHGRYLMVWNHLDRFGFMAHDDVRIEREKYCRAAGI
jgi:hypothetical protein